MAKSKRTGSVATCPLVCNMNQRIKAGFLIQSEGFRTLSKLLCSNRNQKIVRGLLGLHVEVLSQP